MSRHWSRTIPAQRCWSQPRLAFWWGGPSAAATTIEDGEKRAKRYGSSRPVFLRTFARHYSQCARDRSIGGPSGEDRNPGRGGQNESLAGIARRGRVNGVFRHPLSAAHDRFRTRAGNGELGRCAGGGGCSGGRRGR